MAELVAVQSGFALFRAGDVGVVIDTENLHPCDPQPLETLLASGTWNTDVTDAELPSACEELADAALEGADDVTLLASTNGSRVVRVPKKVQDAVRVGLQQVYSTGSSSIPTTAITVANNLLSGAVTVETASQVFQTFTTGTATNTLLYGGDAGFEWAAKVSGNGVTNVTAAGAAEPGDTDWVDPEKPHEYVALAEGEPACALCGKAEGDPIHVATADAGDGIEYFATLLPDEDQGTTFKVDSILAKDADGNWWARELGEWVPTQAPDADGNLLQLDVESFQAAAKQLDEPGTSYAELSMSEDRLFELAAPHLDYELLDAVFASTPYIPPEVRSANAKKQLRDAKGHFIHQGGVVQDAAGDRGTIENVDHEKGTVEVKVADGQTKTVPANSVTVDHNAAASHGSAAPKARIPGPAPQLVPDVHALIEQYKQKWSSGDQPVTAALATDDVLIPPAEEAPASPSPTASGPSDPDDDADPVAAAGVTPLYLAVVDPNDTAAVLECLAVIPSTGAGDEIDVYKRDDAKWVADDADKTALQSATPPPVVELDGDMLSNVLSQMDANPEPAAEQAPVAAAGFAVLQKFVVNDTGLTASQFQGARLLQPYGPKLPGDIVQRLNELAAGVDTHPAAAERLRLYWTVGEGGREKIKWGVPGDGSRCIKHLRKYLGPRAAGYCQLRHHEMTGRYMGHGPGEEDGRVAALVGEVQTDTVPLLAVDPDVPHAYEESETGYCAVCERGAGHTLHVVVMLPHDAVPHEFESGPEGLCECGREVADPLHTMTGDPEPDSQRDYDDEVRYAYPHAFAATSTPGECDCGRLEVDSMHTVTASGVVDPSVAVTPGQRFRIPLVVPEGVESGDGRTFAENSLTSRPMPLALMWQPEGDEGHKGSVIVGRIDHVERTESGLGNAYGVFDTGPWGQEALRLVRAGMLRGISADLDEFEANVLSNEDDDSEKVKAQKLLVNKGRLMGVTLVAKPAYAECTIELVDEGDTDVADGAYIQNNGEARVAALIASAAPLHPPAEWFENPKLTKPTHLTVTDDGRVFGHIAAWDVDHIGLPFGTRAPRSISNYAYFRTGSIRTAEGTDVKVGQLTLTGGHAPLKASAREAVKHYDDTASAVADLAAGEDRFGIWVSGALRPGVSAEQVRALRASSPSGDWRPIKGALELVAVCQVNVPGFPVAEAMVAGGQVTALVAAGALTLEDRPELSEQDINARIAALEAAEQRRLEAQALALRQKLAPVLDERRESLTASAEAARARVNAVRQEKQEALASRVAELRARVGAGGTDVPFVEEKHPRDTKGRFREVLARLENMLKGAHEAQSGIQRIEDAAGKEDAGDHTGAVEAAREGADKLEEAAHEATGEVKARLLDAANDVRKSADDHHSLLDDATAEVGEVLFDELAEPIKEQLEEAVSRAEQKLNPADPDELLSKVKAFITGTNPMSLRDVYHFIKNQLGREFRPHGPTIAEGPSPTSPTVKGPQGPQIGNGPLPS